MNVSKLIIAFISVLAAMVLYFFTNAPYGTYPHILAVGSSVFVFYLLFDIALNKEIKKVYIFPYLLLSWLYFQSPFLLEEKTYYFMRIIKEEYIPEIATYTFFSIALIYIGYHFFFNKSVKALTSKKFQFSNMQLRKLILFFIVVGLLYRLGERVAPMVIAQLSNLIQILFFAPTIVLALYTLYLLRNKLTFKIDLFHLFVIAFIIFEFLIRLSSTLIAQVALLAVGGFLAYFRERRKIPIVWLVIAAIIFLPLYQARKYFRENFKEQGVNVSEVELGRKMIQQAVIDDDELDEKIIEFERQQYNKEHNRFENLSFIAHVVLQHKTGNKAFLYGETFYWLPIVPIPRIIFPSKPENVMSTKVATEYGVRGMVSTASINFPMLIEGYINFGFNGMLVMALLFGMAYKWFVMKFGAGIGDLNLLMIINSIKHFIHAEGNITLVFGALIQIFLFWWVLVKLFNLGKVNESKE